MPSDEPQGDFQEHQTPSKKRKLNQISTKPANSSNEHQDRVIDSSVVVSFFDVEQAGMQEESLIGRHMCSMNILSFNQLEMEGQSEQQVQRLRKKMSMEDVVGLEVNLGLYKLNSTIAPACHDEHMQFGDNIYLNQLQQKDKAVIADSDRNKTACSKQHVRVGLLTDGVRLQEDYVVSRRHGSKHETLICLNKLSRIFHYVKRFANQSWVQTLVTTQVKLYHQDTDLHFLRFHQTWAEGHSQYMAFELAAGSLEDATRTGIRLKQGEVWNLIGDCACALRWLHSKGLHHLNLKPGNLLKCKNKYKLADLYGLPVLLQQSFADPNHPPSPYLAPELRNYHHYLEGLDLVKGDIYSLGLSLIENLAGCKVLGMKYCRLQLHVSKQLHGYSPALIKTLLAMVKKDPHQRPHLDTLARISLSDCEGVQKPKERRRRNSA